MDFLLEIALAVLAIGALLLLALRGLVLPASRDITGHIEAAGLGSLIARGISRLLRLAGTAGVSAAPIDGWIQVSVHGLRPASLVVPIALAGAGGIVVGGGYALKRFSEDLIARWYFTLKSPSKMQIATMQSAVLRITPADDNHTGSVRTEFRVTGLAFDKDPEREKVPLSLQPYAREIHLIPNLPGLNDLGVEFTDLETDEHIGKGHAPIYIYKAKIAGLVIPNDWYDRASRASGAMIWVGGIWTFVDLFTKSAAFIGL